MARAGNRELQRAVANAVDLVNQHSGQASIRLHFNTADLPELDFIANSASLSGDHFVFTAGYETVDGSITELREIRAELIQH